LVLSALVLVSGCATITYDAGTVETLVAANAPFDRGSYETIGRLDVDSRAYFLLANLITIRDADLEREIAAQVRRMNGDAVLNLRIEEQQGLVDVAIQWAQALLLYGLSPVGSRSYTLVGDVVRWNATAMTEADLDRAASICPDEVDDTIRPAGNGSFLCLNSPMTASAPMGGE
jgi:hypothetical protein